MEKNEIAARLKTILAEDMDLNLTRDHIEDVVSFLDDGLALDSISLAEFIDIIEKRFSIQIHDEDMDTRTFASFESVAALIGKRLMEQSVEVVSS